MATTEIGIDEVAARLRELIDEVSEGNEVVIVKDDQPVAKLVGYSQPRRTPRFGSARGLIVIADDFDEPLEDFKEYME